jgi:hypothetical protein
MASITIPEILEQVTRGQIRVPKFQRGFVWEPDRIAYLMDSIYKKFPVGQILFWRTKEKLIDERQLGPFHLPDPKVDYPIDYVLDGQQRITSIFGVFQSTMEQDGSIDWIDVYYDILAGKTAQEAQFIALKPDEVDQARHFPLKAFFNTAQYGKLARGLDDATATALDKVRETFQIARIPVETTETEDKGSVAIIFERVNRQGVELDTFQLLTAWTWSEDFLLQDKFLELSQTTEPFGFGGIGADTNLLLRCCSAILTADASPNALMNINGSQLRDDFDLVENGITYAIDYLRNNLKAEKLDNLPFSTLIVPLSVYFAVAGSAEPVVPHAHRDRINRWLWRSSFSRRYSSGVLRNLKHDIDEIIKLRDGTESKLGDFEIKIAEDFFTSNVFGIGNVNSKAFILMLAQEKPLSFISGAEINLADKLKNANRAEFHHLMPRKFLIDTRQATEALHESALVNFTFLSRAENRDIGGRPPSEYRSKMPADVSSILAQGLIPDSLFGDNYAIFASERSVFLRSRALALCQLTD